MPKESCSRVRYFNLPYTAIFIMVVSPAMLVHDVSVLDRFARSHSKNWETVKLRQRSNSVQPMREKVKSLKHVKLCVDTKAAKHATTDNHYENSCNISTQNCPQNSNRAQFRFQSPKRCILKHLKNTKLYSIEF